MVCIHSEIVQDFRVVHVVGVVCRDWVVTVAHHLLPHIDSKGTIDTSSVWF